MLFQQFLCEFTHTLHWSPFSQCSLATSRRYATNNLFIYSSCTWYSRSCMLKLKVQFCTQRKRFEECTQKLPFHMEGANASLWFCLCRKFVLQNVGAFDWVPSQKHLAVGGVRIGMGCMNVVTAISRYTWVLVTLMILSYACIPSGNSKLSTQSIACSINTALR